MSPAVLSVIAIGVVIIASFGTRLNVGILAVALAWPIAVYGAGWKGDAVMATFPSSLFLTLLGVTLLFGMAQANGTMAALSHRALRLCGGRAGLLPLLFFLLACAISTMGPGAIATIALLAPLAMAAGTPAGMPVLLTALMIGNGANAGNLSPFSAVGVIVSSAMGNAGLGGHEWAVWAANFTAHALAALAAWALFGGPRLLREGDAMVVPEAHPFTQAHRLTLAVGALWVVAVMLLKVNLGLAAFAAAAVLVLARTGENAAMLKQVPWSVLVMVCGVTVLIGVLEKTGGMELFSTLLARISTPGTINGVIAFITGGISTYSSTSGVVYPTFLPMVPSLVAKLGGGDPLQVALSINVGAALVDVSPLSTIGALCLAAIPEGQDASLLFRRLLTWGLSMTIVGALFCQFFIRFFAA
ncbi:MAG: SLC13 family permease [Gemmatimonadota bacterium]|nr:SLC13 family permease [Gemmatimonadota bacterium]